MLFENAVCKMMPILYLPQCDYKQKNITKPKYWQHEADDNCKLTYRIFVQDI